MKRETVATGTIAVRTRGGPWKAALGERMNHVNGTCVPMETYSEYRTVRQGSIYGKRTGCLQTERREAWHVSPYIQTYEYFILTKQQSKVKNTTELSKNNIHSLKCNLNLI